MSFTGLQNTFVPLSINGLSQTFSDTTEVGDLTCNSISIQGIKNPLLNFPISQDNITRFNGTYKLQYTDETVTVFTATNASITFGVALDIGSNNILTTGSITGSVLNGTTVNATDFIGNTLSIKNSSTATNKYLFDYDEKTNNLNLNFLTSSTNDKIFSIDQYGNIFLEQGLYFNGNVAHYIGNIGNSNIIFSIQNTYKYSFLINNVETFFINQSGITTTGNLAFSGVVDHYISNNNGTDLYLTVTSGTSFRFQVDSITRAYINYWGFNTTQKLYLNDSATGNRWSLFTASDLRLTIAFNDSLFGFIDSSTGLNIGKITFVTSLNGISPTVYGYMANVTSDIQTQINSITTSFINKTGTTSGVNCQINLSSGGSFLIGPGYFGITETSGVTSCFKLSIGTTSSFGGLSTFSSGISTNLINTYNASFYDPTSSIQTQLNERITRTGTNTGVNTTLQLASGGNFNITTSGGSGIFTISDTTGITNLFKLTVSSVSTFNNVVTFYDTVNILAGSFIVDNSTLETYISNMKSTSNINGFPVSRYDPTSSIQTQLDNRITKTGTTTGVNSTLQLSASVGAFAIQSSGGDTKMAIASENNFYLNGLSNIRFIASPTSVLYGSFIRNDGNTTLFMLTDINNVNGTWNALRPFYIENSSGKIFSENGQQFTGGLNCDKIQFTADATIPNGFSTEIASAELLLNSQINFRATNVSVNTARQGLAFRLDNRTGFTPFQWYKRLAGSSTETQIMGLSINGGLDVLALTNLNLTIPRVYTGDNTELVIRTGTSDSAPSGSYITLQTASSSAGVNFVNVGNTVNWGSFRSGGFDCNVPARLNNTTNSINAQKASNYNNYVLCQESVNGTVNVSDSQVINLSANGNSWNTGYTFSSIFTKYTDGSITSFVGTVSCYAASVGFVTIRVRFTDVTTSINYDVNQSFYFNITLNHTTIGVSGQPVLPNGVYNVEFAIIAGVGTTDAGDTIKCLVILSPS